MFNDYSMSGKMADSKIFAYVSHAASRNILVFRLDPESGEATRMQEVPIAGKVMPLAVSPDRRFLYAALRSQPYSIASFTIDGLSGRLTHLGSAPLPPMTYISTDRSGRFLFGASIPENTAKPMASVISVSAIGVHGFVQPPHQIIRTDPMMHAILPDPSNRYVLATSCDGDLILRQIFDAATGLFSSNALPPVRVKPGAGPRHFVFHPNNRFLYLLNETDASIYAFGYDAAGGALTELQIVSALPPDFSGKPYAADVRLTPDGRFLYASERNSNTLAAFRVDRASGRLAGIGNFPTAQQPRSIGIDPNGRYLLVAERRSNSITSYAIDRETGNLSKLKNYPTGNEPSWIEIVGLP